MILISLCDFFLDKFVKDIDDIMDSVHEASPRVPSFQSVSRGRRGPASVLDAVSISLDVVHGQHRQLQARESERGLKLSHGAKE